MLIVTTETVAGHRIVAHLGAVHGATVRARHVGADLLAVLKSLIGGEIGGYRKALATARAEAIARMTAEAEALGADAVVGLRLATSTVMAGAAEIVAFGTAVRMERAP